jgi:hypothetical protein
MATVRTASSRVPRCGIDNTPRRQARVRIHIAYVVFVSRHLIHCFVIDLASTLLVIHYSQIFLGWEHMLHMGIWCTLHILNLRLFMFHPMSHDNFTISPPYSSLPVAMKFCNNPLTPRPDSRSPAPAKSLLPPFEPYRAMDTTASPQPLPPGLPIVPLASLPPLVAETHHQLSPPSRDRLPPPLEDHPLAPGEGYPLPSAPGRRLSVVVGHRRRASAAAGPERRPSTASPGPLAPWPRSSALGAT